VKDYSSFGSTELDALDNALGIAREMTGQFFGLPDDWFERTSHQVCTLKDLRDDEILGVGKFAQIRKIHRILEDAPGRFLRCSRLCPHYRICLQDHNILARLRAEADILAGDLLTYVLTHEYVHLVRFDRLNHPYRTWPEVAAQEEARVGDLTRTIVQRLGHRRLRRLVGEESD
jgi:hypothetical protein